MADKKDPSSIFGKIALLFTTLIAVTMVSGGLMYFSDYANNLFSKFAGLFLTYTGGWMFLSVISEAKILIIDILKASKEIIIAVLRTIIKYIAI
ncbi:MAG: hypothetical protein ACOCP4_03905 [Candidatus Woesearchaeota archaeon]